MNWDRDPTPEEERTAKWFIPCLGAALLAFAIWGGFQREPLYVFAGLVLGLPLLAFAWWTRDS